MNNALRRSATWLALGLVALLVMAGCQLSGANAAPVTPVGSGEEIPVVPAAETTQEGGGAVFPTPSQLPDVDVFGTATAMASSGEGLVEATGAVESGGVVTGPTVTPTLPVTPTVALTPAAGATATGAPSADCPPTHTVQPGENLFRIALRYGMTYQELAAANGITNPDQIQAGMVLVIPGCGGAAAPGGAGGTGSGDILHTVQPGENLFRIALRYGLSWMVVAEYNGLEPPYTIYPGQVIRIPRR